MYRLKMFYNGLRVRLVRINNNKMERTEEQKQKLLKDLWYKRNPSHDRDNNGVDRFWETVLCVLEDYKVALTLPDVVKPFYCGSDYNHNAGRCKSQCRMCNLEEKKGQQ